MNAQEALVLAAYWVWERYPVVPPVNCVWAMTEREGRPLEMRPFGGHHSGQWFVSFFCDWETDALGLPGTLNVVDGTTGTVRPLDQS